MSCTLVTAYYEIKSKYSYDNYHRWGKVFLTLKCPIVIFVDPKHTAMIREWRGDKPIHIIEKPFHELEMWKEHQDTWKKHHEMDPEKLRHSPELYAIWAMKSTFVEQAIYFNPFLTEFFFWCDFGAFRKPYYSKDILDYFPMTRYLYHDKIIIQGICPLTKEERYIKSDGIYGEPITVRWNDCRLAGGLWGGGIEGCLKWNEAYKKTLSKYFEKNRFAGKDQIVLLSTYLNDPSLAIVVKPTLNQGIDDSFFFFHELLSNTNTVFMTEPTYILNKR